MTPSGPRKAKEDADAPALRGKRRYEKPRLTDYGHVSKLTLTGSITTRDTGSQKRPCL
jgi:hypothetical protein